MNKFLKFKHLLLRSNIIGKYFLNETNYISNIVNGKIIKQHKTLIGATFMTFAVTGFTLKNVSNYYKSLNKSNQYY